MKKLILPVALLLAAWCLTGAWYLSRSVCSGVSAAPTERLLQPLNVYFESGQNTIIENDDLRGYLSELKSYTASNTNARVTVTGHTDNQGDANQNIRLGQERADFIKNYLVQQGYPANIFITTSKGPNAPISTNDTPEGRAKNRRVEVRLNR